MKLCTGCGETKTYAEFGKNKSKKDGLQNRCRECKKAWYDNYYRTSPKEKKRLYANRDRDRAIIKQFITEQKNHPCMDCGVQYPHYIMDFDHLGDKEFNVSQGLHKSLSVIKAEIAKCELVCANCHRQRTHARLGSSPDR